MKKFYAKISSKKGFTLIELIVSMFILIMVMGAMVAVSVSVFQSYQKSRAIKAVSEDVGFALNSIAKDVRMGKIKNTDESCISTNPNVPVKQNCLMVTRNATQEKICYRVISGTLADYLAVSNGPITDACPPYSDAGYKKIVDLTGTGMAFYWTTGFYNVATDTVSAKIRGWSQIILRIANPSMTTDAIRAETVVSTRDYGSEEVTP